MTSDKLTTEGENVNVTIILSTIDRHPLFVSYFEIMHIQWLNQLVSLIDFMKLILYSNVTFIFWWIWRFAQGLSLLRVKVSIIFARMSWYLCEGNSITSRLAKNSASAAARASASGQQSRTERTADAGECTWANAVSGTASVEDILPVPSLLAGCEKWKWEPRFSGRTQCKTISQNLDDPQPLPPLPATSDAIS